MRYVLIAWAIPMGIIWGWYFLSYNDMHFGYVMLSRGMHDLIFEIYGQTLGIDPKTIPPLLVKTCLVDTALLFSIYAFRRRAIILAWARARRERYSRADPAPSV